MTVSKDERVNMRVPTATKTRWVEFQRQHGYKDLTTFLTDAAAMLMSMAGNHPEVHLEHTPPAAIPLEPVPSPGDAAPQSGSAVAGTGGAATLQAKIKDVRASSATSCPSQGKHRKGIYCKGCRKVI